MKTKHLVILVLVSALCIFGFVKMGKFGNFERNDTLEHKVKKHRKKVSNEEDEPKKEENNNPKNDVYTPNNDKENLRLISWNIQNLGKSKDDTEISYMAKVLKDADVVAVQEVSTTFYGPQAVAKIADALNRSGSKWEYSVSDPTVGEGKERYAYLWKPSKVKLKTAFLEQSLVNAIDREPYLARFEAQGKTMLLVNFHAVPTDKSPMREIRLLPSIQEKYPQDNIIMMGDFNLSEKEPAFDGLKKIALTPAFTKTKTSLKIHEKDGDHFSAEYDNFYCNKQKLSIKSAGRIDFTKDFPTVEMAHSISDHVPIVMEFQIQ